MSVSYRV